jgi:hypothetical protein
VLLETWGTNGVTGIESFIVGNYVKVAVEDLVRPEHKALMLKWLPLQESLAELMQGEGWVQDMRPFLLPRIAQRDGNTDLGVLQAAAGLRDPAAYNDLIWHFENDLNGPHLYDALKNLPGIQLKEAVLRAWTASKSWTDWQAHTRYLLAPAAMDYGATDALELAIEKLDSPDTAGQDQEVAALRWAIFQRTGQSGSNEELRAWFKANKGKLVFDEKSRMFRPGT